jgi:hypothetical protein
MITGEQSSYQWLEVDHRLPEFLELCPHSILGRYVVTAAVDSGSFVPSETDRACGWTESGGLAYSPRIGSMIDLPEKSFGQCNGFDEWYVFDSRPEPLGALCQENVFTTEINRGTFFAFINFLGFALSDPKMKPVTDLFWRQMEWALPESYLGDGPDGLIFATRNRNLFESVRRRLQSAPASQTK